MAAENLEQKQETKQSKILNKLTGDCHKHVAVVGNVDAGKSTLIGTLTKSILDDGRGAARTRIMKHKHEIETGRTSTIGTHLFGMDAQAKPIVIHNNNKLPGGMSKQAELVLQAEHLITLHDLAGHEKYLKTTVSGIAQAMADYALVLVNAAQPPTHMTMHHLRLCVSMGIPVVVVLTKLDQAPKNVYKETMAEVQTMLKRPDIGCKPYTVQSEKDISTVKDKISSLSLTPIVSISCVSGDGLELLQKLLAEIPKRRKQAQKQRDKPFEYLVEECMYVPGIGNVISGFVTRGEWKKGETIYIGPLKDGTLLETVPKSVHVAQTCVEQAWAGHSVCFALGKHHGNASSKKKMKKQRLLLERGMVALKEPFQTPKTFSAFVELVKGRTMTIQKDRFEAVLHILNNKLTAKVTGIQDVAHNEQSVIRQGNRATMTFEFSHRPAYVRPGMRVIIRDGHVRGYGVIVKAGA